MQQDQYAETKTLLTNSARNVNILEKKCQSAYEQVRELVEDCISNEHLALPFTDVQNADEVECKLEQRFNADLAESSGYKVYAAKFGIVIIVIVACLLMLNKTFFKDNPIREFWFLLVPYAIISLSLHIKGSLPLQSVGVSLFLDKQQAKHINLDQKWTKIKHQVENATGIAAGLLCDNLLLERALRDPNIPAVEHEVMARALFGVKNKCFDCMSISGLTILKLIEQLIKQKISVKVERFVRTDHHWRTHSYVVANRTQGDPKNIKTWNIDSFILDGWYGVCKKVGEIQKEPNFFLEYPLLNPGDKTEIVIFDGEPSKGYLQYLEILKEILFNPRKETCYERIGLDVLIPSLP